MKYLSTGEIKDINPSKRIVAGYPSTFGTLDSHGDIVDRGAFARTINAWGPEGKNRIKALYQHDPAWLVGRPLSLREDEFGLFAETQFADTAMARDTLRLIEDGIITEQSIGYDVVRAEPGDGANHLKELRLYEYSFVTWGANEVTPITGVKGMDQLKTKMERMERALKSSRFDSDDVPMMMEIAIQQWKELLPEEPKNGSIAYHVEQLIAAMKTAGNVEAVATLEALTAPDSSTDTQKAVDALMALKGDTVSSHPFSEIADEIKQSSQWARRTKFAADLRDLRSQ